MAPKSTVSVEITGNAKPLHDELKKAEADLGHLGTQTEATGGKLGLLSRLFSGSGGLSHAVGEVRTEFAGLASHAAGTLNPALGSAVSSVGKITSSMGGAGLAATGLAGGVVAAGAVIGEMTMKGIGEFTGLADEVRKVKNVTGATAEESSRLNAIFKMTNVSTEQGAGAFFKLSQNIAKHEEKLKADGIEVVRNKDGHVDLSATLGNVAEAYQRAGRGAEGNKIAMEAFGKSGAALIPILTTSKEQLKEFGDAADKHHEILSQDDLDKARAYQIATKELGESFSGMERELGQAVLPTVTKVALAFTNVAEKVDTVGQAVGNTGVDIVGSIPGIGALSQGLDFLAGSSDDAAKKTKDTKESLSDLADKAEQAAQGVRDQTAATKIAAATLKEYNDTLKETLGGTIDAREAGIAERKAIDDLNKTLFEGQKAGQTYQQRADEVAGSLDGIVKSLGPVIEGMVNQHQIADTTAARNAALVVKLKLLKDQYPALAGAIDLFIKKAEEAAAKTGPAGEDAAANFAAGIVRGLRDSEGQVAQSADSVAHIIVDATNKGLGNASPSKIAQKSGEDFSQGLVNGLTTGQGPVGAAAKMLAQYAVDAVNGGLGLLGGGSGASVGDAQGDLDHLLRRQHALPGQIASSAAHVAAIENTYRRDHLRPGQNAGLDAELKAAQDQLANLEAQSSTINQRVADAQKALDQSVISTVGGNQSNASAAAAFAALGPGALGAMQQAIQQAGANQAETNRLMQQLIAAVQSGLNPGSLSKALYPGIKSEQIKDGKRNGGSASGGYA